MWGPKRASKKQKKYLIGLGYTGDVEALTRPEATAIITELLAKRRRGPKKKKRFKFSRAGRRVRCVR